MDRRSLAAYATATIVIVVSFGAAVSLPLSEETRALISLPGITGLFSIVVQGWRDQIAHERAVALQQRQHDFTLAVASHMAEVAFDKQVAFCDDYFRLAYDALLDLMTKGPNDKAIVDGKSLRELRTRYSPWLSQEIESGLVPFEDKLSSIGAKAAVKDAFPQGAQRTDIIFKMFDEFTSILNVPNQGTPSNPQASITSIIDHLRSVLGISELTTLRSRALTTAVSRLVAAQDKE